ncbi:MAG: hypothetical protein IJS17_00385 [Clostridia bacterium]|nr:hypothetical protein [Clostridia bacterium]
MKKILSILCVLALLMTTSVIAFAADEDDQVADVVAAAEEDVEAAEDDVQAVEEEAEEVIATGDEVAAAVEKAINDIIGGVNYLLDKAGTPSLEDVANVICDKIKADTGLSIDLSEVKALLAAKGIDLSSIKVVTASRMDDIMQAVFDIIGEKYGKEAVDTVYDILKNSKIVNLFAQLYVKTPEETTTTEPDPETTEPDPETTTVEPEVVPATGEASIIAGVAVLAVAAAAAVVCTKKAKKDEE